MQSTGRQARATFSILSQSTTQWKTQIRGNGWRGPCRGARPSSFGKRSTLCGKGSETWPPAEAVGLWRRRTAQRNAESRPGGVDWFGVVCTTKTAEIRDFLNSSLTSETLDFDLIQFENPAVDVCHRIGNKFTKPNRYGTPVHMPAEGDGGIPTHLHTPARRREKDPLHDDVVNSARARRIEGHLAYTRKRNRQGSSTPWLSRRSATVKVSSRGIGEHSHRPQPNGCPADHAAICGVCPISHAMRHWGEEMA